jgi:hypothetical protein
MSPSGFLHRCHAAANARTEQIGLTLRALHGGLVCWTRGRIRPLEFDPRRAGYLLALLAGACTVLLGAAAWHGVSHLALGHRRPAVTHVRPECILTCERCRHTTWLDRDQVARLRCKNARFYCDRCQVFSIQMVVAGSTYCAAPAADGVWP